MFRVFKDKYPLRTRGDQHRDAREWKAAAEAYKLHLDKYPMDAGIWTQLAHVKKEAQDFVQAEIAYLKAASLAPLSTDPLLHLGHMLKGLDRTEEAIDTFMRLIHIVPDRDVLAELQGLLLRRRVAGTALTAEPGSLIFTIQDFFSAFAIQTTMTGIQRVQAGIIMALLKEENDGRHFVINGEDVGGSPAFLRVQNDDLLDLLEYIFGAAVNQVALLGRLILAKANAKPIKCAPGSTIVVLGAFWWLSEQPSRFLALKREGVRLAALIHDVIPITHRDYCDLNFSNAFWRSLAELLFVADALITNSHHTRRELLRVINEQKGRKLPIRAVPLAHSLRDDLGVAGAATSKAGKFGDHGYVLYVSTIEARKNHIYVATAWQRMMVAGVAAPDLVFVGRHGEDNDDLDRFLKQTGNLGGRIHIVHGLGDAELSAMYRGALFTVFTSITEGWGLPVGESLAYGVPCVASRAASISEVGGDFVDYVDPTDIQDGVRVFRRMIEDDDHRNQRKHNIVENFHPRRWKDVARDLVAGLDEMLAFESVAAEAPDVVLVEGDIYRPGDIMARADPLPGYFAHPLGLNMAACFYEAEPDGAWMRGGSGTLAFKTSLAIGTSAMIFVSIKPASQAVGARLSLDIIGGLGVRSSSAQLVDGENLFRIRCQITEDGVRLAFKCVPEPQPIPGDTRVFAVALLAIGYAAIENTELRRELRQHLPVVSRDFAK